jgi:hypothetical protein
LAASVCGKPDAAVVADTRLPFAIIPDTRVTKLSCVAPDGVVQWANAL